MILKVPSNETHATIPMIFLIPCALSSACMYLSHHTFPRGMNSFCTTFERLLAIRNLSTAIPLSSRQRHSNGVEQNKDLPAPSPNEVITLWRGLLLTLGTPGATLTRKGWKHLNSGGSLAWWLATKPPRRWDLWAAKRLSTWLSVSTRKGVHNHKQ